MLKGFRRIFPNKASKLYTINFFLKIKKVDNELRNYQRLMEYLISKDSLALFWIGMRSGSSSSLGIGSLEVDLPEVDLPEMDLPEVDLPEADLPDASSPFSSLSRSPPTRETYESVT